MLPKDSEFQGKYAELMLERKKRNRNQFWKNKTKKRLKIYLQKIGLFRKLLKPPAFEYAEITKKSNYFSEDRIAIYTSIFGAYDTIIEPEYVPDNCDFYIITDQNIDGESAWKKITVDLDAYGLTNESNVIKNRFFKMFPDKIFPNYKYSIYVDGNIRISTDLTEFIHGMNQYGVKLHNHFRRNCVFKEIEACLEWRKDTYENLSMHKEYLLKAGMPREYGLLEAPMIVREHRNPLCIKLMQEWWDEFLKCSKRDQISLPYVLWKNNIRVSELALLGNDVNSNYAIQIVKHTGKISK